MVLLCAQSCYASHEAPGDAGPAADADAADVDAGPWPDITLGPSCPSRVPTLRVPLEECDSILMHPGASSALLGCPFLRGADPRPTDLALVIPHPDAEYAFIYFESLAPVDRRSCDHGCGLAMLWYDPDPLDCVCGDDRMGTQAPPAGRDPETGEPRPEHLLGALDTAALIQLASYHNLELRIWGCSDDVRPPGFLP
jgi:hypothetical protein